MRMPLSERRIFRLAWRTLEAFKAPPDTAISAEDTHDAPGGRAGASQPAARRHP
jgi:hypothetical protein